MRSIYYLSFFMVLFFVQACAQDKKNKTMEEPFEKIKNLYKEVPHYKSEPVYVLDDPKQNVCFYEIYVNDILISKLYENATRIGDIVDLNDVILKSGTQKVTVKLYPPTDVNGKPLLNLSKNTSFELEIGKYDKKNLDLEDVVVKHYFSPTTNGKKDGPFKFAGTPYFEDTFTFEAEVPYTLKGWSESQDLTKMDKEVLEQEVVAYYTAFGKLMEARDYAKWEEHDLKRLRLIAYAIYYNEKESKLEYEGHMESVGSKMLEVQPLEDYEMVFYADGKIVCLESLKHRKGSPLITIEERDFQGKPRGKYIGYRLYLHKPKGSTKLEIIR